MQQPRAIAFVTVLAWLFIVLAGVGILTGLIQNLAIYLWPPLVEVLEHSRQQETMVIPERGGHRCAGNAGCGHDLAFRPAVLCLAGLGCLATLPCRRDGSVPALVCRVDQSVLSRLRCPALCVRRSPRRLRLTFLRWLTSAGPRRIAIPMASTSMTTRWAMRDERGV